MTNPFGPKPLRTSSMQIKITPKEKELVNFLVLISPQKNLSKWVMNLISDEFIRLAEVDDRVEDYLLKNYPDNS